MESVGRQVDAVGSERSKAVSLLTVSTGTLIAHLEASRVSFLESRVVADRLMDIDETLDGSEESRERVFTFIGDVSKLVQVIDKMPGSDGFGSDLTDIKMAIDHLSLLG